MRRPEQILQQAVVAFLDQAVPGLLYFHVPNSSGNRGARLGGILKTMGVKAGVPDLVLILPNGVGAFIELKAGRNGLTVAQKEFRDKVTALGCLWTEAKSIDDVEVILHRWLVPFGWTIKGRVTA